MKPAIQISIAQPCSENWQAMTPTEKGRHCAHCSKEVIDFTHTSDAFIYRTLTTNDKVCGRLRKSQLDRDITLLQKRKNPKASFVTSLLLPASLLSMSTLTAQGTPTLKIDTTTTYQSIGIGSRTVHKSSSCWVPRGTQHQQQLQQSSGEVKGTVLDAYGLPLPGASIQVKGKLMMTETDFDGHFIMNVAINDTLMISYVGFKTVEQLITEDTDELNIQLMESDEILGDVIIAGGISYSRANTPKSKAIWPVPDPNPGSEERIEQRRIRSAHWKKIKSWRRLKWQRAKDARRAKKKRK